MSQRSTGTAACKVAPQCAAKILTFGLEETLQSDSQSVSTREANKACQSPTKPTNGEGKILALTAARKKKRTTSPSDDGTTSVSNSTDEDIGPGAGPSQAAMPILANEPATQFGRDPEGIVKPRSKFVETFSGCSLLTAEGTKAGFDAIGVDFVDNKDTPIGRVISIDLGTTSGQSEYKAQIVEADVVTFAPPCGTASRSREIRRKFGPDPKPLRSNDHPDGIPGLTGVDLSRVQAANRLYKFVAELIPQLHESGKSWFVENPTNSLMWLTSWFQALLHWLMNVNKDTNYPGQSWDWAHTQMCMHGGERNKRASLLYGGKWSLRPLALACDEKHTHKPWGFDQNKGGFATAKERNYPKLFCSRIAALAAKSHITKPKKKIALDKPEAISAGKQPRRSHSDLITEFKEVIQFSAAASAQLASLAKPTRDSQKLEEANAQIGGRCVPGNSKLIDVDDNGSSGSIGIWWSKMEFLAQAKTLIHPLDRETVVPQHVAGAIFNQATLGPRALIEKRTSCLSWYRSRLASLTQDEENLHKGLHANVEKVVAEKNILLFKEMLSDIGYDDMDVVHLLTCGVKLVGDLPATGIWAKTDLNLAKCNIKTVWANARHAQKTVLSQSRHQDDELQAEVWKETLEEAKEKLILGPMSPDQVASEVGPLWVPARRFGIRQGDRVRPIDNFSEFLVNNAFGAEEKISLHGLDHVVAWSRAMLGSYKESGELSLIDNAGTRWEGWFHETWNKDSWCDLSGRVADLKSAYKQVAVHPAHAALSVIAVTNPDSGKVQLFRALALMFGETAAVYAFLRISRALSSVAAKLLDLIIVEFFDDFIQIESTATADSAQESIEDLFGLLGWKISMKEKKRLPFDKIFTSLGVEVDLSKSVQGEISVQNKPGRVDAIRVSVSKIVKSDYLGFKDALSIRGRVAYAEGQLFGRVAAPLCRMLSAHASVGQYGRLHPSLKQALSVVSDALAAAKPRRVGLPDGSPPIIVFTDGACETECTSIGGILIDGSDQPEAFGAVISASTVESWASKVGQTQVIGQAEIFPVLVAKLTWAKKLAGRKVIYFIDNDSARLALVKAYSPVLASMHIIIQSVLWDGAHDSRSWFARVPTESNIADGPSRMSSADVIAAGARLVPPVFPEDSSYSECLF